VKPHPREVLRRGVLIAVIHHRALAQQQQIVELVEHLRRGLRVVPYERTSGWGSKASEAKLKGVEGGD